MKKLLTTAIMLLSCGLVQALPIGNPSEASIFSNGVFICGNTPCDFCDPCFSLCDAWSFRLGFYGDYVFNRHLESANGARSDVNQTRINTNAEYAALNLCDRLDFFATVGVTKIELETSSKVFGNPTNVDSLLKFRSHLSWSIGTRATLFECDCFSLGIEGQYFRTKPDYDFWVENDTGIVSHLGGFTARYYEWQVGGGISYSYVASCCPNISFVPYLGVKYSYSKFKLRDVVLEDLVFGDLKAKKHWGYAVGATITMNDSVGITVEGRFGDEKALYVNGQFRL